MPEHSDAIFGPGYVILLVPSSSTLLNSIQGSIEMSSMNYGLAESGANIYPDSTEELKV